MGLARLNLFAAVLFSVVLLASCAGNIPQDIPENYTAPTEHTFNVPYEKAWPEVVKAVSGSGPARLMNKEGGLIVTESAVVDRVTPAPSEGPTFGKNYKNSYTIKLTEKGPNQTVVKVQTHLTEEYLSFYDRECKAESLAAFLRQELFRRICANIYQDPAKCITLFPSYNTAVCAPPAVKPSSGPEEEVSKEGLDPMWKMEINVKELQQALAREGYDPGPIDGRMGKKTRAALIRFQKDNKLEPTGKLDESTMIALEI